MEIVNILEVINETDNIKTFQFKWSERPKPGQFIMVWLPGVDEIPLAVSYSGDTSAITVENVGDATRRFHELKVGSQIGIKGPFGNGFELYGEDILLASGGTGVIPLARAAQELVGQGKNIRIAMGARTASDLFFVERMKALGEVHIATDDGSSGHHGFVTRVVENLIAEKKPDMILACGPEPMMVAAVNLAGKYGIPIQCSLERYMKCGMGICGSCQLGKYTVCRDGPVFTGKQLSQIEDFGKWKRGSTGKLVWY